MRFAKVTLVNPCEVPGNAAGFQKKDFASPAFELVFEHGLLSITDSVTGEVRRTSSPFFGTPVLADPVAVHAEKPKRGRGRLRDEQAR